VANSDDPFVKVKKERLDWSGDSVSAIEQITFESFDPELLKIVDVSNNALTSLPPHTFSHLHSLQKLRLDQNHLEKIDVKAFVGLHSLKELHLNKNKIASISPHTFSELSRLHVLNLQDNHILSIDRATFYGLDALKDLNIKNNKFTQVPHNTFSQLKSLRAIILDPALVSKRLLSYFVALREINGIDINLFSRRIQIK
jgi:Leucine-rich repeat (LRR) protein